MYWIFIIITLIILLFMLLNKTTINEQFGNFFFPSRMECSTRNMSYDLRGEAYFPPLTNFPFDNSELGPGTLNAERVSRQGNSGCYPKKSIFS